MIPVVPALAISSFTNTMGTYGATLGAGHIVLSGSFARPVLAGPGDTPHADLGPPGSVADHLV